MSLPDSVTQVITQILHMLDETPNKAVSPEQRLALYAAFDVIHNPVAQTAFQTLQIITIRHVIPIWYATAPTAIFEKEFAERVEFRSPIWNIHLPEQLLDLAERIHEQAIDRESADAILRETEGNIEASEVLDLLLDPAYPIAFGASSALRIAIHGFTPWDLWENDTDDVVPMWEADCAMWSAMAISGRVTDSEANTDAHIQKRYEFWTWWLTEAIPQAWAMAE